ncbi:MAG: hypothetical protein ATN36_07915 [Epulopiscium sp. Nele67-Bin005]|nr:MAG: hypothetical protein ATN36_07915 [Epulopiscium sp. Nele67-Bin005]
MKLRIIVCGALLSMGVSSVCASSYISANSNKPLTNEQLSEEEKQLQVVESLQNSGVSQEYIEETVQRLNSSHIR